MAGPILKFLAADHERLDALLASAVTPSGEVDRASYEDLRAGLLRHIGIEEKILFPAIKGEIDKSIIARLHREHGALALLLVPTPTAAIIEEIRSILIGHNEREEGAGGVYASCDGLSAGDVAAALDAMRAYPAVKLAPHFDGPDVPRTAEEAMRAVSRRNPLP
ncbi:MAG TPA: hemerythrin domain-containing protein [Candidatus Polarisedimenticolaceae bacterium]|nr:hemerythrin domain-containing protein [Candidatus Polarisedimenticolaceae bacterium]